MNKKILIVEDDSFLLKLLKLNLSEIPDTSVSVAANGEEALELLENEKPDLMLLDLLMPKLDGYAVLEAMRKKEMNIPVIVLSNLSQQSDRQKCSDLGVRDFFVKSDMDIDELIEKMKMYL